MINYDPLTATSISDIEIQQGVALGLTLIHVTCDEQGAKPGEHTGVSFGMFVDCVPRAGEKIKLQDGGVFRVKQVCHVMSVVGSPAIISALVNVYAVRD